MFTNKAFTLIEMLVAVTIFTLVVGSAFGLFISAIRSQVKALAAQKLLDETSYTIEYMSRFLRMAVKDPSGGCLTTAGPGYNYENSDKDGIPGGDSWAIRFIDYRVKCHEFYLDGGFLKERRSTDSTESGFPLEGTELTSGDFEISSLNFNLSGQDEADDLQPRVTISLTIGKKPDLKPQITIQTTISQRNLDL